MPTSIPADFSQDVTADLLSLIADHPDNTRFLFPDGGQYRVDGKLLIQNRSGITFYGTGAVGSEFRAFTNGDELGDPNLIRDRAILDVRGGSNFSIYRMTLRGANPNAGTGESAYVPARESQHCLRLAGVNGALVDRVTCLSPYGDFLYVGTTNTDGVAKNVTARRMYCDGNGRQAIAIVGAEDVAIYLSTFINIRRAFLDIEPNDPVNIHRVLIRFNLIGPHRLNAFSNVGHPSASIEDIMYADNIHSGSSGPDLAKSHLQMTLGSLSMVNGARRRYRFIRNKSDQEGGSPSPRTMALFRLTDVLVEGNHQPMEAGRSMRLVGPRQCVNVRAINNTCPRAVATMYDAQGDNTDLCSTTDNRIGTSGSLFESPSPFPCA